jgi:uncharacterized protein YegP (UPF0339 family)
VEDFGVTTITRRTAFKFATSAVRMLVPAFVLAPRQAASSQSSGLRFELYRDRRAEIRWSLKARNGKVIATSGEGYKATADCRNAIDLIKGGASSASIDDLR